MMSQAVEEFYNRCHSPSTGRFCSGGVGGGHSGGSVRGDTGGNPNKRSGMSKTISKQYAAYKRSAPNARVRHNVAQTKDGSEPLGRKYRISGDKKKDTLDLMRLDRGSPERKEASRLFKKRYG